MFSFRSGFPIAFIKGGKYNGKILNVKVPTKKDYEDMSSEDSESSEDMPLNYEQLMNSDLMKGLSTREKMILIEELRYNQNKNIKTMGKNKNRAEKIKKKGDDMAKREIKVAGDMIPIPKVDLEQKNNNGFRECIYVAGPSGSGKSTFIAKYAKQYKKLFPKNKVFVFSRLLEDGPIDALKPERIEINDDLIYDPITPEELKNSLVIFDDTDTIRDKKLRDSITELKNDLLETGRHNDVYVCITSHLITNYKETRTVLNESHGICLFPGSGGHHQMKYCLKNYFGLSPKEIKKVLSLRSRWVYITKTYPRYVLYESGCYLL